MGSAISEKAQLARYFTKKKMVACSEIGLRPRSEGSIRADLLAFSIRGEIILVEWKSSKADHVSDSKSHLYLDYCNKAYLACTFETYEKIKDRLWPGYGVMLLNKTTGKVQVVKNAKRREMDPELHKQVLMRVVFREAEFNRLKSRRKAK